MFETLIFKYDKGRSSVSVHMHPSLNMHVLVESHYSREGGIQVDVTEGDKAFCEGLFYRRKHRVEQGRKRREDATA